MPDDDDLEGDDPANWDWGAIAEEERRAAAKGDRLPKCWVCGNPLWCGQHDRHHLCAPVPITDYRPPTLT